MLAKTQRIWGSQGFTANLEISYKAATPLNEELELEASIIEENGRKMFNEARIMFNGEVTASAKGLWIRPELRALIKKNFILNKTSTKADVTPRKVSSALYYFPSKLRIELESYL